LKSLGPEVPEVLPGGRPAIHDRRRIVFTEE